MGFRTLRGWSLGFRVFGFGGSGLRVWGGSGFRV